MLKPSIVGKFVFLKLWSEYLSLRFHLDLTNLLGLLTKINSKKLMMNQADYERSRKLALGTMTTAEINDGLYEN